MSLTLSTHAALLRVAGPTAIAVVACFFVPVEAAADQVVHPTGVHPDDAQNVQAAIDTGGTVVLKATDAAGNARAFDFGPSEPGGGSVELSNDVILLGETSPQHVTTIRGGFFPIRGYQPSLTAIEGIRFDGPGGSAIVLFASAGARIADNVIDSVRGFAFGPSSKAVGIWLTGSSPDDVSGDVVIENNVITGVLAENGDGIALVHIAANVHVASNEIYEVGNVGILINGNTDLIAVDRNYIEPGAGRPGYFDFGNGILVGQSFAVSPLGATHVTRNTVVCANPLADGIILFAQGSNTLDGAVVEQNDLTMVDSYFGGITLADGVSNAVVANNRIQGAAVYALGIYHLGFGIPTQQANAFLGNNVAAFEARAVDAIFGPTTERNVFVGAGRGVVDLGVDNQITGLTPLTSGEALGRSVREALASKLD